MAHTRGLVIKIKKNSMAQVVTDRKNACSGCSSSNNCHSCLSSSKMMTEALNNAGARKGDIVDITLRSGVVLKGAAIMYLIPIAGLLIGALISVNLKGIIGIEETTMAIIFGIAGLCLGFSLVAFISKRMSAKNQLTPIITHIIKSEVNHSPSSMGIDPFSKTKACSECH